LGNLYDHLMSMRIPTLIIIHIHMNSENYEEKWLQSRFGSANHLVEIVCFIF
jgi:hypothetical protein